MANTKYAVVRLDRLSGTTDGSKLLSARYYDGTDPADIQNGMVVHITDTLLDREVFKVTAPTASDTRDTIGLVASVEIIKDNLSPITQLNEFYNKADGEPIRVYLLETGDIFSVTAEAINGTPAKDGYVKLGTTTQWEYSASDTDAIGTIIDVETRNRDKYYVIRVK